MAITKITTPELFNLQSNNTEGTQLPVMTTTQREAMTGMSNGELIFNSTTDFVEYYDLGAATWYKIDYKTLENFNTVLYTGDGSASGQSITSVGFQPDLVWIKTINQATKHLLTDSIRGVNSQIFSNSISSQQDYDEFDSFDSTGFTVSRNTGTDYFNQSTVKYVAWCFKAGGLANKSALFNGSSSYINTSLIWGSSTTLSFSTWFKTDTINVSHYIVGDFNLTPSTSQRRFIIKIAVNNILQVSSSGGESSAGTFQVTNMSSYVNKWTHIAVTVSGTNIKVYLNGTQFGSTFTTGTPLAAGTQPFCIGSYSRGAGKQNFYGNISQTRFFTDVLTDAEVTQLYNETAANNSVLDYPTGTNCIAAYPLGINANDLSNNNNGTAYNVTFGLPGYLNRNNEGTIESTVSVNDTLGFSIAKYTGNTTSGATVGHGLSSTPELIIFKTLESGPGYAGWAVQVASLGGDKYLILDSNQQAYSGTGYFNDTLANSDVITLGSFDVTNDGTDIIAYSFASKPGISKIGTYTGNGGNNPVDVGFKPEFVMIKNTTSSASWAMFDDKRTTANPSTSALYANESVIEEDLQVYFEFTSTGFKNLQSSNTLNASSSIYIYLAFA